MNEKRKKILALLESKDMSRRELANNGISRQARAHHVPILIEEGLITSYKTGNELFYTLINHYDRPQDIFKLIEKMKQGNEAAKETFINLCKAQDVPEEDAKRLALDLVTEIHPNLKAKVTYGLIFYKDKSAIKQVAYDSEKNEHTFIVGIYDPVGKKWDPPYKTYEFFLNL